MRNGKINSSEGILAILKGTKTLLDLTDHHHSGSFGGPRDLHREFSRSTVHLHVVLKGNSLFIHVGTGRDLSLLFPILFYTQFP
jgi:hypothetical protein